MNTLLFILLTPTVLIEGTGLIYGHHLGFLILVVLAIASFIYSKQRKISSKLKSAYLIFLIFSAISALFAENILLALQIVIFYAACGLMFIASTNNKEAITKTIVPIVIGVSLLLCLYHLFSGSSQTIGLYAGFQFAKPIYGAHNHLGDFLILPLIICLFLLLNKIPKNSDKLSIFFANNKFILSLTTLFFIPFFLFSFSRSAYLAIIITFAFMIYSLIKERVKISPTLYILPSVLIIAASAFFVSISLINVKSGFIGNFNSKLVEVNSLSEKKSLTGSRDNYFMYAIRSTVAKPLIGVGPGNFINASKEFVDRPQSWTTSAHNIFLDILAENGVFAFIAFIYALFLIFKRTNRSLYFFLALALLINFQADYTYRIYSMLILFSIFLGLSYGGEKA